MRFLLASFTGMAFGLAPTLAFAAPRGQPVVSDAKIEQAGAALHDVAKLQEKYQGKLETVAPGQKQKLAEQATAETVQAIQSHGLSVQEYSNVVHTAQGDPLVRQHLMDAANKDD